MQLRNSIIAPARFADEEPATPRIRDTTTPGCPIKSVPFNPDNPPAAFPSLPLFEGHYLARNVEREPTTTGTATTSSDSQQTAADEPETMNSLSGSLAGYSSDDDEPASDTDLTMAEESDQGDEIPASHAVPGATTRSRARLVGEAAITAAIANYTPVPNDRLFAASSGTSSQVTDSSSLGCIRAIRSRTPIQPTSTVVWSDLPLVLQYRIFIESWRKTPSGPTLSATDKETISNALGLTELDTNTILYAIRMRVLHPASVKDIVEHVGRLSAPIPGLDALQIAPDTYQEHIDYISFAARYETAFEADVRRAKQFLTSRGISPDLIGVWLPDLTDATGYETNLHYWPAHTTPQEAARSVERTEATRRTARQGPVQDVLASNNARLAAQQTASLALDLGLQRMERIIRAGSPLDPNARPSHGETSTTLPHRFARAENQETQVANNEPVPSAPSAQISGALPHRLVLKINKDTGLAGVFRKAPPPAEQTFIPSDVLAPFPPAPPGSILALLQATGVAAGSKRKAPSSDVPGFAHKVPRLLTDGTGGAVPATPVRVSPGGPNFSPISENEDVAKFQALVEPFKHRLRAGSTRFAEQSSPTKAEKKRPQKLILTFKGGEKFATGHSTGPGSSIGTATTTTSSTRVLTPTSAQSAAAGIEQVVEKTREKSRANVMTRASERRKEEAALAAKAVGIMTRSMTMK